MKIVNSNDETIEFKPDNVIMLVPTAGGFAIIGQRIHEQMSVDMDTFVTSLPNVANFTKLTWVGDIKDFWANALQVKEVRPVDASTKLNYPAAQTDVVFIGGANRVVIEEPDAVVTRLHAAGTETMFFVE